MNNLNGQNISNILGLLKQSGLSSEEELKGMEPSQKAAIFATAMAMNGSRIDREMFLELFQIAEQEPENLTKAMSCEAEEFNDGRLVLQAAYFAMRYPRGQLPGASKQGGVNKLLETDTQGGVNELLKAGIQGGVNKPLEAGKQDTDIQSNINKPLMGGMGKLFVPGARKGQLDEQAKQILKAYEHSCLCLIPRIYEKALKESEIQRMKEAVELDRVDSGILQLARASRGNLNSCQLFLLAKCAYLNYTLSAQIKNLVSICLAARMDTVLECMEQVDLYGGLEKKIGNFDVIFGVDSVRLIQWAAMKNRTEILKTQLGRNPEVYMSYMDRADYSVYRVMSPIVEEMDGGRYQKWLGKEHDRQRLGLVETFANVLGMMPKVAGTGLDEDVRGYLRREKGVEVVYACQEALKDISSWGFRMKDALRNYQRSYGYDSLSDRCETLLIVGRGFYAYNLLVYLKYPFDGVEKNPEKVIKRVFAAMESQRVDILHQLDAWAYLYESADGDEWQEVIWKVGKDIFNCHIQQRREEMLEAIHKAGSLGRNLGLEVLIENIQENREEILKFASDSSKAVRKTLLQTLYDRKDWSEEVAGLLQSKKASAREVGIQVLAKWMEEADTKADSIMENSMQETEAVTKEADAKADDIMERDLKEKGDTKASSGEKYIQMLTQALEKEKNTKVRSLLEQVLQVSSEESKNNISEEELIRELHKGNKKRVLAWAYGTPLSKVHRKDGGEAEEIYLQAILLCYYVRLPYDARKDSSRLAAALEERDLAVYVREVFDKWVNAGADSKKRWVLYAAAVHGGAEMVDTLYDWIQRWPKDTKGAVVMEAVRALTLSPEKRALILVDEMSQKSKARKIKVSAAQAMDTAAAQLGIVREELADKIVPDLGFDRKMQRIFDYGPRKFIVVLTLFFELEIFDENNKKLKTLPVPGKRDDALKAAEAYESFKQLKKELKTLVSHQKIRLTQALSTGRRWKVSTWKKLFVEHPIMWQFAIGLVWGIYEDGTLKECFRHMEDGSYTGEEGEEFILPDDETDTDGYASSGRYIALVHPIELSEASLIKWKEQLLDYEIIQPIVQVNRPMYYMTEEEAHQKNLERFGGMVVNGMILREKLETFGWKRGPVEDAGRFYTYCREDKAFSLEAELHFSGNYVGNESGSVTVYEVRFYKTDDLYKNCALKDLPGRYFSEIILQISQVASGMERNENWKNDRE